MLLIYPSLLQIQVDFSFVNELPLNLSVKS